jgi:8-oxo-dGTP pyrophosphatase MutT (NUDIX family)
MIEPWKHVGSKPIGNFRIFDLRADRAVSPRTGNEHEFYVISCTDWVNVIAVTPDEKLVMVEQYRHGTGTVELEVPGGMMDPGEASPEATGARELREETGCEGENVRRIGRIFPNPAIMTNTCHTVLIENCRQVHEVDFDHGEDLVTRFVPVEDIPELIRSGKIRHSLVVVALYHYELFRRSR